jgi:hypothetical protein
MSMTAPLAYVDQPDCPPGMTLDEYRRLKAPPPRPSLRQRASRLRRRRSARRRRAA